MSSPEPWRKHAVLWLLFFWLLPLAWLIKKMVFFVYIKTMKAMRLREKSANTVPVYPMN